MSQLWKSSNAAGQLSIKVMLIAAGLAVVLGLVGLYGVIGYAEIGVRLAPGARPGQVQAMGLRQGLGVALGGVALGFLSRRSP